MDTLLRIKIYIDSIGVSVRAFEAATGMSNGSFASQLKRNASMGVDRLENILRHYPDLNVDWVITGCGEMTRKAARAFVYGSVQEPAGKYERVPLVDKEAFAGFGSVDMHLDHADVKEYYTVPDFQDIQFMIRVQGSSMYPKYTAGDIVACRILHQPKFIQWNKTHVVITREQGLMIKRIKPGTTKDRYTLMSDNKEYDSFEIPRTELTGIALVVGVIRVE